jgi:hypothetical protein
MNEFGKRKLSMSERIPILLTSAITATAPFTKVTDAAERIAATLRALSRWMTLCSDTDFVLCDGSGYDLSRDLKSCRSIDPARIEMIAFENDRDEVRLKGKGHGEGEIVRYALENSMTLKSARSFAKCTGKLWVDNYWSCRKAYNGMAGFSYFGFLKVTAVDTRFFIVQKDFFQVNLSTSYTRCDDARGKYLENVYLDSLAEVGQKRWMLSVYPSIRGLSGTSGKEYQCSAVKRIGKNLAIQLLMTRESPVKCM